MKPLLALLAGLVMLAGTPVLPVSGTPWRLPVAVKVPTVAPPTATAAVYVYEKDESAIPVGVTAGINKLNRDRKITATLFEKDTIDGHGQTPAQYKPALDAAKRESIPALVILSGSSVVKVVKSPKTEAEVIGAVP